jgi:hypothetical protein
MLTRKAVLALALVSLPAAAAPPVARVSRLHFHSDMLVNLHHVLYAAAWARRTPDPSRRVLAGPLPAPLDARLGDEERRVWTAAVDHYDKHVADRDLLFGDGMEALKAALARGDLAHDAVGEELRRVLTGALPIYRRRFWPSHDRANRKWIAAHSARVRTIAPEVIARLEKLYQVSWFAAPVRVDVVWVGNRQGGYTSVDPTHVVISSGDPDNRGWTAAEMVFHEVSHALVDRLQARLERALGDRAREHGVLWHVVLFHVTGGAVKQVLAARGVDYTTYMESTGLFDRAWGHYRAVIEENWQPYVDGKLSLDQAIAGTVKELPRVPARRR